MCCPLTDAAAVGPLNRSGFRPDAQQLGSDERLGIVMLVTTEPHMTNTQASSNGRVLHSWKEIATYMGRGVRTIQRYEAHLGLPVRRPSGAPRSAVLAFSNEIDQWLAQSPTRVESSQPPRKS